MSASLLAGRAAAQVLRVSIAGTPLVEPLARALSLVLVRQALGVPAAAELDFALPGGAAPPAPGLGAEISLALAGPGEEPFFTGRIASLEHQHGGDGGRILRLRAYDALQGPRRRRRARTIEDASAFTLAREMAGELGLPLVAPELPPARAVLVQRGESDLALLAALAAESGLYPVLRDGALRLVALDGEGEGVPLRLGRELWSLTLRSAEEAALARVEARAWDPATLDAFREEAARPRQAGLADAPPRPEPAEGGDWLLLDRLAGAAEEAEAAARAALDRAAAAAQAVATGLCAGDPLVAPGRPVEIAGAGEGDGRYVVTSALHRFSAAEGYTTEFSTLPPAPPPPSAPALTLGTVSATDDPEEMGRCRVELPGLGGAATGWLPVLVPGGGKGKGMVAFPEVGDQVLVALPDGGDAARGFVLGGLHGRQRLPRGLAARRGGPRAFVLRTAGGQALELSSQAAQARLATSAGSLVEMAPGRMRIAAASDLVIEAPGKTITIRAEAVRFEQG